MLSRKNTAAALWILIFLFVLRVLGQLAVVISAPDFLPPMEKWYSGLMPYPLLLPSQILIIAIYGRIAFDISRGRGFWFEPKKRMGFWLLNIGMFYFAAMVLRYYLQGISIPVIFHWVLASFLIVLGLYHKKNAVR